ncbi:MAG: hypothetical protein COB12_06455 [Flavobacterium sp.]|nr:MAG: hypothetical protein COB12_06455 [Flavobacterium sp.]
MNCHHIECSEQILDSFIYCNYHRKGGVFGNGETYEQYQIIEQDFIDFIKIIPINDKNHLKIHSPVLRDIIIRCCVQIEDFFKEWAKYECVNNQSSSLFKQYHKIDKKTQEIRGARNWNFSDYHIIIYSKLISKQLHVRPLEENIEPFQNWTEPKRIPNWWNVYNGLKHDGINNKKKANLSVALNSLGALFLLHCNNKYTKNYLKNYSINSVIKKGLNFELQLAPITTPLDTKRYLFKDILNSRNRNLTISTDRDMLDRVTSKGKIV